MAGMPPGPHKVKISLVNANHEVFPGTVEDSDVHNPKGSLSLSLTILRVATIPGTNNLRSPYAIKQAQHAIMTF